MLLDTASTHTPESDTMPALASPPGTDSAGTSTASTSGANHPGLKARLNSALAGLNNLSVSAQAKTPSISGVQQGVKRYHAMISHGQYKEVSWPSFGGDGEEGWRRADR